MTTYYPVFIFIAGMCAVLSTLMVGFAIFKHLLEFNEPLLQKYIVRILFMVPIYALGSFMSLILEPEMAIYIDLFRDCYEAFVLYAFFQLLIAYLGGENALRHLLERKAAINHPWPLCCWKFKPGSVFLWRCKQMILQFVILKPSIAVAAIVLGVMGHYHEGSFAATDGYPYLMILANTSVSFSLYFLILFYLAIKDDTADFRPVAKFLCVKAVIFFAFWQAVALNMLVATNIIKRPHDSSYLTVASYERVIQDFIICLELVPLSVAFVYAFGPNYKDPGSTHVVRELQDMVRVKKHVTSTAQNLRPLVRNVLHVSNMGDIIDDAKESLSKKPIYIGNFLEVSDEERRKRVVRYGWMKKRGGVVNSFKRRCFYLLNDPPGLVYFKTDIFDVVPSSEIITAGDHLEAAMAAMGMREPAVLPLPIGFIDFRTVISVYTDPESSLGFAIKTAPRTHELECDTDDDACEWVLSLEEFRSTLHVQDDMDEISVLSGVSSNQTEDLQLDPEDIAVLSARSMYSEDSSEDDDVESKGRRTITLHGRSSSADLRVRGGGRGGNGNNGHNGGGGSSTSSRSKNMNFSTTTGAASPPSSSPSKSPQVQRRQNKIRQHKRYQELGEDGGSGGDGSGGDDATALSLSIDITERERARGGGDDDDDTIAIELGGGDTDDDIGDGFVLDLDDDDLDATDYDGFMIDGDGDDDLVRVVLDESDMA
eukprot:TRINITY_DN5183_c0_g1_i3.p1 TRINITY_DN5183_c0_g1~~TRINITY_DN5183_c0_g1_i3.p1  ORF type:complete len:710 (-),score=206.41 TRINITY_DN5183_c0_g1_i3:11-2140(-)